MARLFKPGFLKLLCKLPSLKKLKKPWSPLTRLLKNYHKKQLRPFFLHFICNFKYLVSNYDLMAPLWFFYCSWPPFYLFAAPGPLSICHGPQGGHFAHFGKPWFKHLIYNIQSPLAYLRTLCPQKNCVKIPEV